MRTIILKLGTAFFLLLVLLLFETFIIKSNIIPMSEFCSNLSTVFNRYICVEQGYSNNDNTFIIEGTQIRIHSKIHLDDEQTFNCENTLKNNCYLAAYCINTKDINTFFIANIINGKLPQNNTQICINKALSKRLKLNIGDEVLIKSALLFSKVSISGITNNFYGLNEYKNDYKYYVIHNRNMDYITKTKGTVYSFSNDTSSALYGEKVEKKVQELKHIVYYILFVFVLINSFFSFLIMLIYDKSLQLSQYYKKLYYLGKEKKEITKKIINDFIIFFTICLIISLIPIILLPCSITAIIIAINAIIISINYIIHFGRRNVYFRIKR